MWPLSIPHVVPSKSSFFLQFPVSLEKTWRLDLPSKSSTLPSPPRPPLSTMDLLFSLHIHWFVKDWGPQLVVLFPSLSPAIILSDQYPEDCLIPCLSNTLKFHPLTTNLSLHLLPLHGFSGVFELPCAIHAYLPPLTVLLWFPVLLIILSSLDGHSLVGIVNPSPWTLHILNQLYSLFPCSCT